MRATGRVALAGCGGMASIDDAGPIDATVEPQVTSPCVVDAGVLVTAQASLGSICPPCPVTLPMNDSACDPQLVGIECEDGDSDDWECNAIARCMAVDAGTRWSAGAPAPCPLVHGGPCPVQEPSVFGCCSAPPDMRCDYGDSYCVCDARGGTSQARSRMVVRGHVVSRKAEAPWMLVRASGRMQHVRAADRSLLRRWWLANSSTQPVQVAASARWQDRPC